MTFQGGYALVGFSNNVEFAELSRIDCRLFNFNKREKNTVRRENRDFEKYFLNTSIFTK